MAPRSTCSKVQTTRLDSTVPGAGIGTLRAPQPDAKTENMTTTNANAGVTAMTRFCWAGPSITSVSGESGFRQYRARSGLVAKVNISSQSAGRSDLCPTASLQNGHPWKSCNGDSQGHSRVFDTHSTQPEIAAMRRQGRRYPFLQE